MSCVDGEYIFICLSCIFKKLLHNFVQSHDVIIFVPWAGVGVVNEFVCLFVVLGHCLCL